jgi:hypothetical protein
MEVPMNFSFVVETIRRDTARRRCSTAPIPADGAEGSLHGLTGKAVLKSIR